MRARGFRMSTPHLALCGVVGPGLGLRRLWVGARRERETPQNCSQDLSGMWNGLKEAGLKQAGLGEARLGQASF